MAGAFGTPLYLLRVLEPSNWPKMIPMFPAQEAAELSDSQLEAARQEEAVAYLAAIKEGVC
jgi:hypothetical protein